MEFNIDYYLTRPKRKGFDAFWEQNRSKTLEIPLFRENCIISACSHRFFFLKTRSRCRNIDFFLRRKSGGASLCRVFPTGGRRPVLAAWGGRAMKGKHQWENKCGRRGDAFSVKKPFFHGFLTRTQIFRVLGRCSKIRQRKVLKDLRKQNSLFHSPACFFSSSKNHFQWFQGGLKIANGASFFPKFPKMQSICN